MLLTLQDKLGVLVAHITDSSAVEKKNHKEWAHWATDLAKP